MRQSLAILFLTILCSSILQIVIGQENKNLFYNQIKVEPLVFIFNNDKVEAKGTLRVRIKNISEKTFLIKEVITTCGCVKVVKYPKEIRRGETDYIIVQIEKLDSYYVLNQRLFIFGVDKKSPVVIRFIKKSLP